MSTPPCRQGFTSLPPYLLASSQFFRLALFPMEPHTRKLQEVLILETRRCVHSRGLVVTLAPFASSHFWQASLSLASCAQICAGHSLHPRILCSERGHFHEVIEPWHHGKFVSGYNRLHTCGESNPTNKIRRWPAAPVVHDCQGAAALFGGSRRRERECALGPTGDIYLPTGAFV